MGSAVGEAFGPPPILVSRIIYSGSKDEMRHGLFPKDDISKRDSTEFLFKSSLRESLPFRLFQFRLLPFGLLLGSNLGHNDAYFVQHEQRRGHHDL